jgi:hypothetical protein
MLARNGRRLWKPTITWPESPGVTGRGKVCVETNTTNPTRVTTRPKPLAINRSGAERFSRGCRSLTPLLRRGRSAAFADPQLNALEAHHVWMPSAGASVLPALAEPILGIGTRGSMYLSISWSTAVAASTLCCALVTCPTAHHVASFASIVVFALSSATLMSLTVWNSPDW